MSPAKLLAELNVVKVNLWADGDQLRFRAPVGTMTDSLRMAIVEHKAELLKLLGHRVRETLNQQLGEVNSNPRLIECQCDLVDTDGVAPCPTCGSAWPWWKLNGEQNCMACTPPTESLRLLKLAEGIRRNTGKPSDHRASAMIHDLEHLGIDK